MKKILIIEDDEILHRMYKRVFSLHGFNVIVTSTAEHGLEQAISFQPDVILLDVMLPNMLGVDLVPVLKKQHKTKHIPIVMLSNLAIKKDIEKVLNDGASLFITKNDHEPIKVLEEVNKLLKNTRYNNN